MSTRFAPDRRTWRLKTLAALALGIVAGLPTGSTRAGVAERRTPVVAAIQKVQPSVVSITSEKRANSPSRWPFSAEESGRPRVSGMGTGVIVDQRGFILTNQHVVDKVQGVEVHLHDGAVYPARVVQQDVAMDLAVLKIDANRPLVPVMIGSSADLMIGESVITIGNAFGYENTTSVGVISALGRNVTLSDEQVYRNLIQTDACINPGNSGGPLINIEGELIGINVAVRAGAQGIGFALPIDEVKRVATEMMSTRRLAATWHGLITGEVFRGERRSLVVSEVQPGSPAEQAGLLRGDEVIRVGDFEVRNPLDVERSLLDIRPGQRASLLVRRAGEEKLLPLEPQSLGRNVGVRPAAATAPSPPPGAAVGEAEETIWRVLGIKAVPVPRDYVKVVSSSFRGGLYVQDVSPGSPAARAAIQKGDILVGMNVGDRDWETIQPDNLLYLLRQPNAAGKGALPFYLIRRNEFVQGKLTLGGDGGAAELRR